MPSSRKEKKMKTELELQKEFIEKPELQEQLKFLQQGGLKGLQGVVIIEAFLKGIRDLTSISISAE